MVYKDKGLFSRGKVEGNEVTTHLHLVLRLWMNAVILPLPCIFIQCKLTTFILKQGKK